MPKPLLTMARDLIRAETPISYAPARQGLAARNMINTTFTNALDAYGAVPQLQALISRWAQDTAQVTWHLYQKRRPGTDPTEPRREVTNHAAWDLWQRPNPWVTQQQFIEASMQHLLITGESDWCIAWAGSIPLELWLARPDRMSPVPHREKFLAGWVYEANGERVPLMPVDVIQTMIPNPSDPYRGLSPVQALMPTLQAADSATKWWLNFFRNGAAPGGALQVEKNLGDEEFDRLTRQWQTQHKGVQNAHRMAILEAGMHYEPVTPTMREMQFTELLALPGERIREAYSFPKPILGGVDDVNRANAEAGAVVYGRYHLTTALDRYRDALNTKLLPKFGTAGKSVEFDFDSPIPEDAAHELAELAAKTQAYTQLLAAGVDPEDAAKAVGLPPMRMSITAGPAPAEEPATAAEPVETDGGKPALTSGNHDVWDAIQKAYLGVDVAVTSEEVRGLLNREFDLGLPPEMKTPEPPPEAPTAPGPGQLPTHAEPDGDEDQNGKEPPGPEEPTPLANRGPRMVLPANIPPQDGAPAGGPPPVDQHDLASHQADWEAAVAALVTAWVALRVTKIKDLIDQIRAALRSGDVRALPRLRPADHGGGQLIIDHLTALWDKTAKAETKQAHGMGFPDVTAPPAPGSLEVTGRAIADLLDQDLATAAARIAVGSVPPIVDETTADTVAATVAEHLDELTDAQPTTELGGALTQTQGQARLTVMDQGPSPAYYSSAVLDRSTCPNCASLDGKWLGNTIPEVQVTFPGGQYRACEGGHRCRCQVVATYRSGNKETSYEKKPVRVP